MKTMRLFLALSPIAALLAVPTSASAISIPLGPDFNGDGDADHALGARDAVVVRYGGGDPTETLTYKATKGFGENLAAGDFNADGYDDLAVGLIDARNEGGEVRIFWGGSDGLMSGSEQPTSQLITQADIAGDTQDGAIFGIVAAGDVTGDGIDDLAIGAPFHTRAGALMSGIVNVVPGANGVELGNGATPIVVSQDSPGVTGKSEGGDFFGWSVAIGDLTGDGIGDLVVGAAGENDTGMVHVLPGSGDGPTGTGSSAVAGTSVPGVSSGTVGEDEIGPHLGFSVAVGDVTGDTKPDVVAGAPFVNVGKAKATGGVVTLRGDGAGIDASRATLLTQSTSGVVGTSESGDMLGFAVAAGDVDGDGDVEAVVGSPGEAIGAGHDEGVYVVLNGNSGGLTGSGSSSVSQDTTNVPGTPESDDGFGAALDLQDVDADGRPDVVVGAPGENAYDITDTGTVAILPSDTSGRPTADSKSIFGKSYGVKDLGQAVVAGAGFMALGITSSGNVGTAPISAGRAGASSAVASAAAERAR